MNEEINKVAGWWMGVLGGAALWVAVGDLSGLLAALGVGAMLIGYDLLKDEDEPDWDVDDEEDDGVEGK